MLNVGEVFVYGTSGVVRVSEITSRTIGCDVKNYYVLQPVFDERSTLYVPTDCEKLQTSFHPLPSRDEATSIIDGMSKTHYEWIENDKERSEAFKNVIEAGERSGIAEIICAIHRHKDELSEKGKKLRSIDETMMQRAEKLLYSEIAFVLGVEPCDVREMVIGKIHS